jgi:hypothetical protein
MAMKIINYSEDCMRKIVELNATLPLDQHFFPACIWPRDLEDLRFSKIGFYVDYRLNDTSPSKCFYSLLLKQVAFLSFFIIEGSSISGFEITLDFSCTVCPMHPKGSQIV